MLKNCQMMCQDCYWYADGIGCLHPDGDKATCEGFLPYRIHQFPIDEASVPTWQRHYFTAEERKFAQTISMFFRPTTKQEDDLE